MSMAEATVGTTKRSDTFSPASSGSVHILVIASLAVFAWIVHMPGTPALSATSMSSDSASRTSPMMMRLGRMRSASLTRRRSGISPVPSSEGCLHCRPTTSRRGIFELEDLFARDDALARRDGAGQRVQERGLSGLGRAGHKHVEARRHGRAQEAAACW